METPSATSDVLSVRIQDEQLKCFMSVDNEFKLGHVPQTWLSDRDAGDWPLQAKSRGGKMPVTALSSLQPLLPFSDGENQFLFVLKLCGNQKSW